MPDARVAAPVPYPRRPLEAAQEPVPRFSSGYPPDAFQGHRPIPSAVSTTGSKRLCRAASRAIADGASILVLSDCNIDARERGHSVPLGNRGRAPPFDSPRDAGARTGIVVESGEPREVGPSSHCSSVSAREPSIRTWRSRRSPTMCRDKMLPGDPNPASSEREVHQSRSRRGSSRSCPRWGSVPCFFYQGAQIFDASASTRCHRQIYLRAPRRAFAALVSARLPKSR